MPFFLYKMFVGSKIIPRTILGHKRSAKSDTEQNANKLKQKSSKGSERKCKREQQIESLDHWNLWFHIRKSYTNHCFHYLPTSATNVKKHTPKIDQESVKDSSGDGLKNKADPKLLFPDFLQEMFQAQSQRKGRASQVLWSLPDPEITSAFGFTTKTNKIGNMKVPRRGPRNIMREQQRRLLSQKHRLAHTHMRQYNNITQARWWRWAKPSGKPPRGGGNVEGWEFP